MKQVQRYKCDYCRKTTAREKTMENHEKTCVHNPNCLNCFMCANAYEGDYEQDEYSTINNVPICAYYEEIIQSNNAPKCSEFARSNEMYWMRDDESKFPCMEDD
mgnify:CR=1 FL=1